MDFTVDPIKRLRLEAANRAQQERAELLLAYKEAVAPDIRKTEEERQKFEDSIGVHSAWIEANFARLFALLPRTLRSIASYEMKRDLYRSNFASILTDVMAVSANTLFGSRLDGQRDNSVFANVVAGIKNRLGQARGLCGQIHRDFLQIEVELVALEKRGFGLPPEPAPLMKAPKLEQPATPKANFDARRAYKPATV